MRACTEITIANVHEKFLNLPQCTSVIAELNDFMNSANRGSDARIGSLRGLSRVGKTALTTKLRTMYPDFSKGDDPVRSIIYSEVPGNPSIKGVLDSILKEMGASSLSRDGAPQKILRIKHFVRELGVRLIILDEFQHLLRVRGSSRDGLYDTIKTILNVCKCPILAVGTDSSLDVIEEDSQLAGRCIYRREIRPFLPPEGSRDEAETGRLVPAPTFRDFQGVIRQCVRTYEFPEPSDLEATETATRLYGASNGLFGKLVDIIDKAALLAKSANEKRITKGILDRAILTIEGDRRQKNKGGLGRVIDIAQTPSGKPKRINEHRDVATVQQALLNQRASIGDVR
jgi:hypothetical protein